MSYILFVCLLKCNSYKWMNFKKRRTQYVTKICSVIVWLIPEPYLIGAAEERFARVHLHQDTAQGPHVYSQVIRHAQQHLRRAVKPTLDVLVNLIQKKDNNEWHAQTKHAQVCTKQTELS